MREIQVNLWDDYIQKPQYTYNEPTTIAIESLDKLDKDEIGLLRKEIFNRCLQWKRNTSEKEVDFIEENENEILVTELSEDKRNNLYEYLCKDSSAFGDVEIKWVMES